MPRKDRSFYLAVAGWALLLNTIPFIWAAMAGGEAYVFDGVLLNPLDGHTYLAKMYQGWRGDWRFTLPYTVNPGDGAYINMIYLFLGHIARLTHLSLPLVYSMGRIVGGVLLLFTLYRFYETMIADPRPRRVAFALSALGSGLGWLLVPTGVFTADFWVAEAYPFLSMYTNPHFPMGLALILWLLMPAHPDGELTGKRPRGGWVYALVALALAIISPFGVVIAVGVLAGWWLVTSAGDLQRGAWGDIFRNPLFGRVVWMLIGGAPILAYQLWAIRTDPILAEWDAQNLTPTPPWWDVLIAFSPALFLSFYAGRKIKTAPSAMVMAVWVVIGLVLILIPMGLQRRFMMGLFIPLAGLAALGLEMLAKGKRSRFRVGVVGLFLLSLPTNLVVILAGQAGVGSRDPLLFQTREEASAIRWIETQTPSDAIILASPGMGLIIPAFSGRQVIYGHPFETIHAEEEKQGVVDFFQTMTDSEANMFLIERDVDYIFYGPRERMLGDLPNLSGLEQVFEAQDVQIYAVRK